MSTSVQTAEDPVKAQPAPVPPRTNGQTPSSGGANQLQKALKQHSRDAKQRAAAILEVLAGGRSPTQAAQALGVSLGRYYLLEDKALAALVAACEPQPRGQRPDGARRLARLERECQRWQRECARQQALVRAAQRSIGLAAPPPPAVKDKGKKRRRRPVVRALAAVQRLRQEEPAIAPAVAVSTAAAAAR
jgi:hypothetical protein